MKCPNCNKDLTLEEYTTEYFNNDNQNKLIEHFWCPNCDKTIVKVSYYKKSNEEVHVE